MSSSPLVTAEAARNRTLTKRFVIAAVALGVLVIVPMLVVAAHDLDDRSEELDGLLAFLAILASAPAIIGIFVALVGLAWRTRIAGPLLAVAGLTINVFTALWVASFWFPTI